MRRCRHTASGKDDPQSTSWMRSIRTLTCTTFLLIGPIALWVVDPSWTSLFHASSVAQMCGHIGIECGNNSETKTGNTKSASVFGGREECDCRYMREVPFHCVKFMGNSAGEGQTNR